MEDKTLLGAYLGIMPRTPEETVLRLLVETGVEAVGAQEGSLLVYDPEADELRFAMVCGNPEAEAVLLGQDVPMGQGVTGLAAQTRDVQIGAPTFKDFDQSDAVVGSLQSVIAAPMDLDDRLVGVLTAVTNDPDKRFSSREGQLLGSIGHVAAMLVDQCQRLRLFDDASASGAARALMPAEPAEREVLERIGRLLQKDPAVVRQVAIILEALEAIASNPAGSR